MKNKSRAEQIVDALRPLDDVFWQKLAESREFCQEVLQIILQNKDLTIISSIPQKDNNDNHQKRVRYNGSNMDTYIAEKGIKFDIIPDVYVIYLSRFDVFQREKTTYHVDRILRETGEILDNGYYEVYVNATVDDKTDIAALMKALASNQVPKDDRFQIVCKTIENLKVGKGRSEMCQLVEEYKAEGEVKGKIIAYRECGLSVEEIAKKVSLSIEEVEEILANE